MDNLTHGAKGGGVIKSLKLSRCGDIDNAVEDTIVGREKIL